MSTRALASDRGSAPAALIIWVGTGSLLLMSVLGVGVASHEKALAQSAADLAALSASDAAQVGGDGCAVAAQVATANDARLGSCNIDGVRVRIEVERSVHLPLLGGGTISAQAVAGPEV